MLTELLGMYDDGGEGIRILKSSQTFVVWVHSYSCGATTTTTCVPWNSYYTVEWHATLVFRIYYINTFTQGILISLAPSLIIPYGWALYSNDMAAAGRPVWCTRRCVPNYDDDDDVVSNKNFSLYCSLSHGNITWMVVEPGIVWGSIQRL